MKIGFSGTREGMSERQKDALQLLLDSFRASCGDKASFHHGACVGADAQAHNKAWMNGMEIVVHPPEKQDLAMKFGDAEIDRILLLPPKTYMERNQAIVDACDLLIAAPRFPLDQFGGGTWATVEMARKAGKPVLILDP